MQRGYGKWGLIGVHGRRTKILRPLVTVILVKPLGYWLRKFLLKLFIFAKTEPIFTSHNSTNLTLIHISKLLSSFSKLLSSFEAKQEEIKIRLCVLPPVSYYLFKLNFPLFPLVNA